MLNELRTLVEIEQMMAELLGAIHETNVPPATYPAILVLPDGHVEEVFTEERASELCSMWFKLNDSLGDQGFYTTGRVVE